MRTHEDFEFESDADAEEFIPDTEPDAEVEQAAGARIAVDLLAFGCELAMLTLLAVAGWGLGNGGLLGIALGVLYPALVIVIWSFWVAPKAARRLADPWRLLVQVALFVATGVALGLADHLVIAIVFPGIASLTFIATRFIARRAAP